MSEPDQSPLRVEPIVKQTSWDDLMSAYNRHDTGTRVNALIAAGILRTEPRGVMPYTVELTLLKLKPDCWGAIVSMLGSV